MMEHQEALEAFGGALNEVKQKAFYNGPVTIKDIRIESSHITLEYVIDSVPETVHTTLQYWF